mgnify:CR=1 FL=1
MNVSDIRTIMKLYDRMLESVCHNYQLSKTEITIINFLQHNPEKDTAVDIVELHMLAKSQVSSAVESLIQKGLLARKQDTIDRRRIHLTLLPEAHPITDSIGIVRKQFHEAILDGFTDKEIMLSEEFSQRISQNAKIALGRREQL